MAPGTCISLPAVVTLGSRCWARHDAGSCFSMFGQVCPGAGPPALPVYGHGLRGDAGTYSPSALRAAGQDAIDGDAGAEDRLRAARAGAGAAAESGAGGVVRGQTVAHLAETVLRFQRLDGAQTGGKTAVHASESGDAGIGSVAGTLALEQFSGVRHGRERAGTSE